MQLIANIVAKVCRQNFKLKFIRVEFFTFIVSRFTVLIKVQSAEVSKGLLGE